MNKFFASEASRLNNNARREQEGVVEATCSTWVANARAKLAKAISYGMGDGEVDGSASTDGMGSGKVDGSSTWVASARARLATSQRTIVWVRMVRALLTAPNKRFRTKRLRSELYD